MFASITYIVFGVMCAFCVALFLYNRNKLREMPIYAAMKQISKKVYLLPLPILAFVSLVGICLTSLVYSSLMLTFLMAPFIFGHLSCEPMILKRMVGDQKFDDAEFLRMITYGLRSRKYLLGILISLCMMFVSFLKIL